MGVEPIGSKVNCAAEEAKRRDREEVPRVLAHEEQVREARRGGAATRATGGVRASARPGGWCSRCS